MDITAFVTVNGPLSGTGIIVNIFFCFCLLCPGDQREALNQPLKLLLILLVASNLCLQAAVFAYLFSEYFPHSFEVEFAFCIFTECCMYTSMSSCLWLSVWYYTKIVPAQQSLFIWIKRNIETIVLSGLLLDIFLALTAIALKCSFVFVETEKNSTVNPFNFVTIMQNRSSTVLSIDCFDFMFLAFFIIIMALSWSTTLVYLCRHMKRMKTSSSPLSSSRLGSQLRVTIMGIVQTILSIFLSCLWFMYWYDLWKYDENGYIYQTIILLFSSGTTVNLGLNQSLLRTRAAGLFRQVFPMRNLQPVEW